MRVRRIIVSLSQTSVVEGLNQVRPALGFAFVPEALSLRTEETCSNHSDTDVAIILKFSDSFI